MAGYTCWAASCFLSLLSLFYNLLFPHPVYLYGCTIVHLTLWYYGKSENLLHRLTAATFNLPSSVAWAMRSIQRWHHAQSCIGECACDKWSVCKPHSITTVCYSVCLSLTRTKFVGEPLGQAVATRLLYMPVTCEKENTYYDHVTDMPSAELGVGGVLHVDHPAGYQDAQPC